MRLQLYDNLNTIQYSAKLLRNEIWKDFYSPQPGKFSDITLPPICFITA